MYKVAAGCIAIPSEANPYIPIFIMIDYDQ